MITVDELAQEIRRVDGNHKLGAGALAEALMPALTAAFAAMSEPVCTVAEVGAGGHKWLAPYPIDALSNVPVGTPLYAAPQPAAVLADMPAQVVVETAEPSEHVAVYDDDIPRLRELVERAQSIISTSTYPNWHDCANTALTRRPTMSNTLADFRKFVDLIEGRAMACDGPVTPFLEQLHVASDAEKERFTAILAKIYQSRPATQEQIKHMVDRFLSWRLPEDFSPDAGITFKREFNENTPFQMKHEPSGTNLLNANQAEAMIRHLLHDTPSPQPGAAIEPAPDLASENERLRAALTPSAETRTAYIGEFSFLRTSTDEHGNELYERITVPWTTVKDIMKAIREHAALERT